VSRPPWAEAVFVGGKARVGSLNLRLTTESLSIDSEFGSVEAGP
jgi:hypothetical protein